MKILKHKTLDKKAIQLQLHVIRHFQGYGLRHERFLRVGTLHGN